MNKYIVNDPTDRGEVGMVTSSIYLPPDTSYNLSMLKVPLFLDYNKKMGFGRINHHYLGKPVYLLLQEIEKGNPFTKLRIETYEQRLLSIRCDMDSLNLSYSIVCDIKFPATLLDMAASGRDEKRLKGKEIGIFIKSHKEAFEQSILYFTIYHKWHEVAHYCEQSRVGKRF